jgi:hypothetical protein
MTEPDIVRGNIEYKLWDVFDPVIREQWVTEELVKVEVKLKLLCEVLGLDYTDDVDDLVEQAQTIVEKAQ